MNNKFISTILLTRECLKQHLHRSTKVETQTLLNLVCAGGSLACCSYRSYLLSGVIYYQELFPAARSLEWLSICLACLLYLTHFSQQALLKRPFNKACRKNEQTFKQWSELCCTLLVSELNFSISHSLLLGCVIPCIQAWGCWLLSSMPADPAVRSKQCVPSNSGKAIRDRGISSVIDAVSFPGTQQLQFYRKIHQCKQFHFPCG